MANGADEEETTAALLRELGQEHLLEGLEPEARAALLAQARQLDAAYSGGLRAYVGNARELLQASERGDNPFEGYTPSVPGGERVVYGSVRFNILETIGIEEAKHSVFVLVAGGLGERLGFSGIKLALPASTVSGWSFLELYCRFAAALSAPLVIMTSDDTHASTAQLLSDLGLEAQLLKQEKVACLADSSARLSRTADGLIETKPHGHGDVHALLHRSGLARKFADEGRRWVVFFQDTNGLFLKVAAAVLGISVELGFTMNSVAVPRRPKDAMGGIARLVRSDGSGITINVEYNQLDPLLRAAGNTEGDSADATGLSPFPGNMNTLVIAMEPYVATLERTGGLIAEFVNPKYADATRTKFKSSTRLECMMQDFPKELPSEAKVGFTLFEQWVCYSPVKNSPKEAMAKFKAGNHPQSATTGETDLFAANCRILRMAGVEVEDPQPATFNGIDVELHARVVWSPEWAKDYAGVRARFPTASAVRVTQRSTLILDGDITIEELNLDGALVITARPGSSVRIARLSVANDGWILEPTGEDEADEVARIRGFRVERRATRELLFETAGEHVVDEGHNL